MIHGLITVAVAAVTAYLIYGIWFPGELSSILKGTGLYQLILIVEICLGPLISIVIFNPAKSRRELVRDYLVVGCVQIAAFVYGVCAVAAARPVFSVFVKDRLEVVSAIELKEEDLAAAGDAQFSKLPWLAMRSICTESPQNPQEKSDLLMSSLTGKDIQLIPRYYRACHKQEVFGASLDKADLFTTTSIRLGDLPQYLQTQNFRWLPVSTRFGYALAVFPEGNKDNPVYINLNPYMTR